VGIHHLSKAKLQGEFQILKFEVMSHLKFGNSSAEAGLEANKVNFPNNSLFLIISDGVTSFFLFSA